MNTKTHAQHDLPRPPLVKGDPVIGILRHVLTNPFAFMNHAYTRHGSAFRIRVLKRESVIIGGVDGNRFLSGPGKELLSTKGFLGKAAEKMGCPHMLLGADGPAHLVQRNTIKPMLKPEMFQHRIGDLAEFSTDIINHGLKQPSIAVGASLRQLISNQIGFSLQGYKTDYKEVEQLIYYFSAYNNIYGMRKWPALMLYTPKFLRAKKVVREHSKRIMAMAASRSEEERLAKPYYLDALLQAMDESDCPFTQGDREIHALLPFVLALDTVAATLGFMLERIINEPHWLDILQPEIDKAFADGIPDLDTLHGMQALNGFAKETLRLMPPAFGVVRTATRDFEFKGYQVKANEDVVVFTTADHRNEKYFPRPLEFDINRYSEPRNEHRQVAYSPFGKGSHACLGTGLSDILLPLNFGMLLHRCRVTPACDMNKVKLTFNPAPVLSDNFRVSLSAR